MSIAVETLVADGSSTPAPLGQPSTHARLRNRVAAVVIVMALVVALLAAIPRLRPVVTELGNMRPFWIATAIGLELASCLGFVLVFGRIFEGVSPYRARRLAWTSMASGALLPAAARAAWPLPAG
jgi:hypothetical protein